MAESLNIYQRLLKVIDEVGALEKTGRAAYGGNYEYHKIDDVVQALRPHLVANGVFPQVSVVAFEGWEHEVTDDQGRTKTHHGGRATVEVIFVNVEDPTDRTDPIRSVGMGLDVGDKVDGKAIAYALKSLLLSNLQLRGQPDNESEQPPSGKRKAPPRKASPAPPGEPDASRGGVGLAIKIGSNLAWGERKQKQAEARERSWELILQELERAAKIASIGPVSEGQKKRLFACAKQTGWESDALRDEIHLKLGISLTELPWSAYDAVMMMFGARTEGNEVVF